jgi:hypothetical protein
MTMNKPKLELADIFRRHIGDYRRQYHMSKEHYEVVYDILSCRTAYLGGHLEKCDHCGLERPAYNSCRNRHCPKCQSLTKERWLQARKAELLPVIYFHSVFTLPHELNAVILCNKKLMLTILFKATSKTLQAFGKNPANGLGGKIGFITFLHTWDQKLLDHFHLHCLIPGGALAEDKSAWIECPNDYLFSQSALSLVFRGKFMDYFNQAYQKGELIFAGNSEKLGTKSGFNQLKAKLWAKNWVVDIEDPIDRPENVLEYVGRYTHRVAISNDRLICLKDGKVTFAYKNRETKKMQTTTIEAVEFIRRFLLHVLPKGFMRIRHYGFLANRCKRENLLKCRQHLNVSLKFCEAEEKSIQQLMLELTGIDITQCPKCKKGTMKKISDLPQRFGENPFYLIHPDEFKDTG